MKVTVCQLSNDTRALEDEWDRLLSHCRAHDTELLLLPEMPFHPWIAHSPEIDHAQKTKAVQAHETWMHRIEELGGTIVAYTKPVIDGEKFYNTAYVWTQEAGHQKAHTKYFFPEEEGFYEKTWFDREAKSFELLEVKGLKIGFLLCTEIWFTQYTRQYGLAGMDVLLCPRASGLSSIDQWKRCGQTSSIIGGAYCLSSNRSGRGEDNFSWGGTGWISQPMDGALLGVTTDEFPFVTVDIDIEKSKHAKTDYPLYVDE